MENIQSYLKKPQAAGAFSPPRPSIRLIRCQFKKRGFDINQQDDFSSSQQICAGVACFPIRDSYSFALQLTRSDSKQVKKSPEQAAVVQRKLSTMSIVRVAKKDLLKKNDIVIAWVGSSGSTLRGPHLRSFLVSWVQLVLGRALYVN